MKKFIKYFLLFMCLSFCISAVTLSIDYTTVYATKLPDDPGDKPDPPGPGPDPNKPTNKTGCACTPLKQYEVYTPKVTELHSMNAYLDANNTAVYFMPKLEDFPFSLPEACLSLKETSNGGTPVQHNFSIVCAEYFDSEVDLKCVNQSELDRYSGTSAEHIATYQTSKKVYSSEDNSRLLNLCGYDLLLSKEEAICSNIKDQILTSYNATKVGNSDLQTETIVMDIYKCLGVEEFDLTFIFSKDKSFNVNESHILSHISFLTSGTGSTNGFDLSTPKTYVFATRTNPDQYWLRASKDALFDGGAHNITSSAPYIGSECSVSKSFSRNQNMTFSEFCTLARAMMTLYGEPVVLESELEAAYQLYGTTLPKGALPTQEEYDAVMWCAAKGLIDPTECDFTGFVNFADIEPVLLRIADETARLNPVDSANFSTDIACEGYVSTNIALNENATVEEYEMSTDDWYDYLIEVRDTDVEPTVIKVVPYINESDIVNMKDYSGKVLMSDKTGKKDTQTIKPPDLNNEPVNYASNMQLKVGGNFVETYWSPNKLMYYNNTATEINLYDGNYKYFGVEKYYIDGVEKEFYHFKINKKILSSIDYTFGYPTSIRSYDIVDVGSGKITKSSYVELKDVGIIRNLSEFSIASAADKEKGGVFTFNGSTWVRQSFDLVNFSTEFLDEETYNARQGQYSTARKKHASNEAKVIAITAAASAVQTNASYITSGNDTYDMTKLLKSNGTQFIDSGRTVKVSDLGVYCTVIQSAANEDWIRFEFSGKDVDTVKETDFYKNVGGGSQDVTEYPGYYRADSNTLLISYNYLQQKGVVSGISQLKDNSGYVITIADTGSNVILYQKDDKQYIMAGDTIYTKLEPSEKVFLDQDGDVLINYRACIGWANNIVVTSAGENGVVVMPIIDNACANTRVQNTHNTIDINLLMPKSTVRAATITTKRAGTTVDNNSLMFTGSYALAPYIIVIDGTNNTDHLFVWHRNAVISPTDSSKTPVIMASDSDNNNRSLFTSLTGLDCPSQSDYSLAHYTLDHNEKGSNNPKGIKYRTVMYNTKSNGYIKASHGYVYEIPTYDVSNSSDSKEPTADTGLVEAINDYIESGSDDVQNASDHTDVLAIPIIRFGNSYYDVNFNTCTDAPGSAQLPVGTLPYRVIKPCSSHSSMWDYYTRIAPDGTYVNVPLKDINGNDTGVVDNAVLYTAPVSNFARLKALGNCKASEIPSGSLYYGTSKAKVVDGSVTITGNKTSFSADSDSVCTYKGISNTSVYAVTEGYSSIGSFVEAAEEKLELLYNDPLQLVDWEAYTFSRLIQNVDNWSSIVLIFCLNILPRVFMLLFFVLMLLSLIANVKPWRMFNQKVFDVYKFLTFGHISVDTVNMKQLFFTSMICLSIFFVIMDGQLFNFIIWICKFFIALYQH